jgi:DNA-binding transcriptional LysR family regulator
MYEWSDLRFFLATARAGSTLAAARELGVNQTTVARRIAALEAALGARLFERHQDGYRLTEAGETMLPQAQAVATESETLERLLAQRTRQFSGVIRVTTPEIIANMMLTPWLAEFMEIYPDIKVEVIATDERLSLSRGEADVAIRAGRMPKEAGIVVRKLADGPWGLYCSKSYAQKRGLAKTVEELNDHLVIGANGSFAKLEPFVWLSEHAPRATVRTLCSTLANVVSATKAGHGISALPTPVGDAEPDLVHCLPLNFQYSYYLVTREALKDVPRVKAFNAFIIDRSAKMKHVFEGGSARAPKRSEAYL